ncbi:MAG: hypothetical protein QM687_00235 [Ferruginibacter sp.]
MRLRKEILLFYLLIVASAGVIIAADQPRAAIKKPANKVCDPVKCSKLNKKKASPALNYISEGIFRFKA